MKRATLLHNPTAGDEDHEKKDLVAMIEAEGFECRYSSTKDKDWKELNGDADFVIVAGGDGTVKKMTTALLNRRLVEKNLPIALLPLGTANNIARTLELDEDKKKLISGWHKGKLKKYDIGRIENIEDCDFFLESFGYGIFPYLMKEMKKRGKEEIESPEEKIQAAQKLLHQLILDYEPHYCHLVVDGVDHSGKFMMVEVMNTKSIGPNLVLAPKGDPGDGLLDIVIVPEADKDIFAEYVLNKLNGVEKPYNFVSYQGKNITIAWSGTHVHVDDKVIKITEDTEINIELKPGLLDFLVS